MNCSKYYYIEDFQYFIKLAIPLVRTWALIQDIDLGNSVLHTSCTIVPRSHFWLPEALFTF